tara:strand:+ start:129 stop:779 length:651 start_codon:yes stop_codon:yes gene_type:complete
MNRININIDPIFSSPIATIKTNIDVQKILKIAEKEKYRTAGEDSSLKNHVSIGADLNILNKKNLKLEKKQLENYVNFYCKNILKYKNKFKLTTSWFTKSELNETSDPHNHGNSVLSAVLYLKATSKCGAITFKNIHSPAQIHVAATESNIWNSDTWNIVPEDGLLIIFPSYLYHKILPGQNKEPRYSLAINYFPVGKIGYPNSDSFLNVKDVKGVD